MQRVHLAVIVVLVALVGIQRLRRTTFAEPPGTAETTHSAATASAGSASAEATAIERLTPNQLTALIRRYPSPTVLVLYGTRCPLCRELMPGLEEVSSRHKADGVLVHAVNVDPDSADYDIAAFFRSTGATFPAIRVSDHRASALASALGSAGSEVIPAGDTTYTMPIVVVWGRSGAVVAQAQGMASSDELERVVSGVLAQGR
jgi:thiol-disulfide isomerase/thioredoxin